MNNRKESDKTRAESIDAKDDTLENATNASTRKLSLTQSDHNVADQTDNDEDQDDDAVNTV